MSKVESIKPTTTLREKARATNNSLRHWKYNLKVFPTTGTVIEKRKWFKRHCSDNRCALCKLFKGFCFGCDCPLHDSGSLVCCVEYTKAYMANQRGKLRLHHIRAVRDRLEKENKAIRLEISALKAAEQKRLIGWRIKQ